MQMLLQMYRKSQKMAARKAVMFVLCVHIYVLFIKLQCGIFDGNNADLKKNIFNTVGFIDCIKLLRFQNRLYHRTEKIIQRSVLFLLLLLACGDIEVTLVLDKQAKVSLYTN